MPFPALADRKLFVCRARGIRKLNLLAIGLLLAVSIGCGSKRIDVTNDPAFGDFKSVVGAWKTKVPLRLVEIDKESYLVCGDQSLAGQDLAVMPVGTEIHIEHLIYWRTFETTYLEVYGRVAAESYSNKPVYIDSRLFTPVDYPQGSRKGTPTQYYSVWNGQNYPKPHWSIAPDKLEPIAPGQK